MSVETPAFQAPAFLLGQAMAHGLPSKKRVTAGIMLGISPTPVGVAAALTLIRSARRAQRATDAPPRDDPKGDGGEPAGGTTLVEPITRGELAQDTKEMLDAVTDAADAVGAAARQSAETQAKMLAVLVEREKEGATPTDAPPPPPAPSPPPPAAARKGI